MPRTARMTYVPLDVEFFDNARILEAGEKAAWLYLNMLTRTKKLLTDGVLTDTQISRLHVTGWKTRLRTLVHHGLVEPTADGRWLIVGFLDRNLSAAEVAEKRAADRYRKRNGGGGSAPTPTGPGPHSGPRPDRFRTESARPLREVEGEGEEERRGDVDDTTYQAPRQPIQVVS